MKKTLGIVLLLCTFTVFAAEIEGVWQTISDKDGRPEAFVAIERQGNEYVGTIQKVLRPDTPNPICEKCPDEFANKPVEGLKIIWGLKSSEPGEFESGRILDPANGSIYRLKASLSPDGQKLVIRGFLGVSFFGRSQTWHRKN